MKTFFIVLSALTIASLSSCKKQYSCECKSTYSISGGSSQVDTQIHTYSEKMKEKQAESACDDTESKLTKTNNDYANDVTYFSGETVSAKTLCEVK